MNIEDAKQCIKNSCEGLALEVIEKYYENEIERLNNILNEIESIVYADISNIDARISIQEILDKLKEGRK